MDDKEYYMTENEYLVECSKYNIDIAKKSKYNWSDVINSMNKCKKDTLYFTVLIEVRYNHVTEIVKYSESDKLATEILQHKLLKTLSGDLKNILNGRTKPDLVLSAQEEKLNVHRTILSARSPVFDKMLQQDGMNEVEHNIVVIDDVKLPALKELVAFMYSAQFKDYDFQTALELYYAADKYDVLELREICARVLVSKLTLDDTPKVLHLADMHQDVALKDKVMQFIKANY